MKALKALNKTSQVLAVLGAVAAFVLFFIPYFAKITSPLYGSVAYEVVGATLCFGGQLGEVGGLAISSQILFCFILTVITAIFAGLTFTKFGKGKLRYAAPAVGLVAAIYMLVMALGHPGNFVDSRVEGINQDILWANRATVEYGITVWLIVIALFAAVVFGICHLFVSDRIMVAEGKRKKTILQRLVTTLRDYKSELKKIVWPGLHDVVKNTLVVFAVCLVIGAFIWLLDFGLGSLMDVITKLKQ